MHSNSIDHDELISYCNNHCYSSVLCNAYSTTPLIPTLLIVNNPSLECGSSPAASEAVYVRNADGSSSNDNRRNTRCVDLSTITTHSRVSTTRLSITQIHPIEGIVAAIAVVGDGLVVLHQILLCINCINFTSVRG